MSNPVALKAADIVKLRQVAKLRLLGLILLLLKIVILCSFHSLCRVLDSVVTLSVLAWNAESLLLPLKIALLLVHHLLLKLVVLHTLHVIGRVNRRDHLGSLGIEFFDSTLLITSCSLTLRALTIRTVLLLRLQ